MSTRFNLPSNDPALLEKATRVAAEFVRPYLDERVVGIVFLGAIARGYFDTSADIDIGIFKAKAASLPLDKLFYKVDGFEVQVWLSEYDSELANPWDMSRRWAYSQGRIHYDPTGKVARLLAEKVPLRPEERRWLLMSGLTLSEWYVNGLTRLWVERGNITSAQHMFNQGLNYFFDMLFGLNNELVADMKWRYYCAEQLELLPSNFRQKVQETLTLHEFSESDLARRKSAFFDMWNEMKPLVEKEVGLSFEEMVELV